jgi:cob(I)alamin adenosyltransferase
MSKRVVTLGKLYTRTGDDGSTGLVGGGRVGKDDPRIACYGTVDELNACLGLCAVLAPSFAVELGQIQQRLFDLGSELANPEAGERGPLDDEDTKTLERWVDAALVDLPVLTSFVLPGGGELGARLHLARTVCRRVEREMVALTRTAAVRPVLVGYVNRLSDLLFAWSRRAAQEAGIAETLWKPKPKR